MSTPGRIESQIALDLMPYVRGKEWQGNFCEALTRMLDKYTKNGSRALARRNYVEASREVAKAYRIWDMKVAICRGVRKTHVRKPSIGKRVRESDVPVYGMPK